MSSWYPGYFLSYIQYSIYNRPRLFYNLTEGESNYVAGIASFLGVPPEDIKPTKGEKWVEGLESAYLKPGVEPPPLPNQSEVIANAQEKYDIEHPEEAKYVAPPPKVSSTAQTVHSRNYGVDNVVEYEVDGRRMWYVRNHRLF